MSKVADAFRQPSVLIETPEAQTVPSPDEATRRELKIRRAAEFF